MKSFERLVGSLKRLPGVGPKQAERMATYMLRAPASESETLAQALRQARSKVRPCKTCLDYTEDDECRLCSDPGRDRNILCVVEQPADVAAIERSRSFSGLYHVLHGRLSPLHGVGPDSIRIGELLRRLDNGSKVGEVILATNPDTEGEATALYLAGRLKDLDIRVSRIAQGVPMGGHLDYMDEQTLSCALTTRREFSGES
jgi:recombination protein RecR